MTRRPVTATARLEIDADEARYIRVIPRDPWAPMVTARWRPRWSWARTWRHRERVRWGAWEGRPTSVAWKPLDLTPYLEEFNAAVKAITDAYLQNPAAVAAVERSLAQTGTGEGPPISGPENAYKCEGER